MDRDSGDKARDSTRLAPFARTMTEKKAARACTRACWFERGPFSDATEVTLASSGILLSDGGPEAQPTAMKHSHVPTATGASAYRSERKECCATCILLASPRFPASPDINLIARGPRIRCVWNQQQVFLHFSCRALEVAIIGLHPGKIVVSAGDPGRNFYCRFIVVDSGSQTIRIARVGRLNEVCARCFWDDGFRRSFAVLLRHLGKRSSLFHGGWLMSQC
jgi:hypothetical protein